MNKRSSLIGGALVFAAALTLCSRPFGLAASDGDADTDAVKPPCWSLKTEECTDCPGKNSFYCAPNRNGAFTSCTQLAPSNDCTDGYCAEADLGPTGGHCS